MATYHMPASRLGGTQDDPLAAHEAGLPPGLRVMVLEDEAIIAMLLEDMLADMGCEVMGPVADVPSALSLIADKTPQMALLDVNLSHGESSYKVAEALAHRGVPFAFVTGYSAGGLQAPFRDRPTLQKPFHLAALADVLRRVSGGSAV